MLCALSQIGFAQTPSASEILENSIKFHDPDLRWEAASHQLNLRETRPNGSDRITKVSLDISNEEYRIERTSDGHKIVQSLEKGGIVHQLDGNLVEDTALISKYRLTDERAELMKNYYLYLYGLPMKLKDPGTILSPEVVMETFDETDCWKLKVTYDPEVGEDIWYFYFDQDDYSLAGYRFYHDEGANDGEYILLEGRTRIGDLLLPARRKWFMHKDNRFLGEDILEQQ